MPSFVRLLAVATVAVTTMISAPRWASAQTAERKGGPERGTWAAEGSTGGNFGQGLGQGASLIRFVSPSTALIGGFSFSRTDVVSRTTLGYASSAGTLDTYDTYAYSSAFTTISLQAGIRRYTRTGLGLRPLYGGGLLFTRQSVSSIDSFNSFGGYAEAGAAWLFNPHVSLGATGGVSGTRQSGGWSVGGSVARLIGTVYF
jgi:hypothetical protein